MANVPESLLRQSVSQQLGLVRFEERVVRDVVGVLNAADADLADRLREAPVGGDAQRRLLALQASIRGALREAYAAVGGRLAGHALEAARTSAEQALRQVEAAAPFRLAMERLDPSTLRALVERDPFQGRLLRDHVANLEANRMASLTAAMRNGVLLGENNDQIARRVRGTKAAGYRDGALEIGRVQAEALTRTAVQHVHAEARELAYQENADVVGGIMAVVTLDERVCVICGPRDGLVWGLDHQPDRDQHVEKVGRVVEWGGGPGRWHWRCRCTSIAVLRDPDALEAAGLDLSRLSSGERSSIGGPVPVGTDYTEWLRGAPRDERVRALGEARASWWEQRPEVSLSDAWRQKFGGAPVEAATLAEVTPPAPPPPPERFVASREHFDAVIDPDTGGYASLLGDAVAQWNEHVGEDPRAFFGEMFRGYAEQGIRVADLTVDSPKPGQLVYKFRMHDDSFNVGTLIRSLDFNDGSVHHDYFQLPKAAQGGGLAKQTLAAQVRQYQRLGISRVETFANIDVGGYAWAKYGYVPEPSAWRSLRGGLEKRLQAVEALGAPSAEQAAAIADARAMIQSKDPRSLWDVSDLSAKFSVRGKETALGKLLLLNSSWEGVLDLADPASLRRLLLYLGGA